MSKTKKERGYAYPHMFFHPKTGDYVICNADAEIPDKFVDSIKKVESYDEHGTSEIKKSDFYIAPTSEGDDEAEEVTLKSLGLDRKEALNLLREAKVEVNGNAKNNELAALISEHFDDEDDADDDSE